MCLRSQAQRRDGYFFIVTSLAFRAMLERVATLEGFAEKISQMVVDTISNKSVFTLK